MPTRVLTITALTLAVALIGSSCSGSESENDDQIRILLSAPLSGGSAEAGQSIARAAELAAKQLNQEGGIPSGPNKGKEIVIDTIDDEDMTPGGVTAGSTFVDNEKYWALTGFWTSGVAAAAGSVLERAGLSMCAVSGADFLTTEADNIYSVAAPLASGAAAVMDYLAQEMDVERVAIIRADFSFLDNIERGLEEQAQASGVEILSSQIYKYGDVQDFRPYLSKAAADRPDVILDGSLQAEKAQMFRQADELGILKDIPIVDITQEGLGQTFVEGAGELAVGAIQMQPGPLFGAGSEATREVAAAYQDEYQESMSAAAMYGYQCMEYIVRALEVAETREDMFDAMENVDEGEGPLGPLGWTDRRQTESTWVLTRFTGTEADDQEAIATYKLTAPRGFERTDAN